MTPFKKIFNYGMMISFLMLISCAYFNTFYNARVAFDEAEKSRIQKTGESLPRDARTNYLRVIDKSNWVLDNYPGSRWEEEAYFLIGVSRYHLGEVALAEEALDDFLDRFPHSKKRDEVTFWINLCKWKSGMTQVSINNLTALLDRKISDGLATRIYLALAGIHQDMNNHTDALNLLEKAAELATEEHEKDQINNRISDLAFRFGDYDRAEKAYRQVIKHSFLKERKENAQLQIIKILRLKNENEKAMNLIRDLLQDENFKKLYGDLELEMAKIYFGMDETDRGISRLKKIVNDYPQTNSSAEAYYLLGEDAIHRLWDLETALEYFNMIAKEYSQSVYRPFGRTRIKEINTYRDELVISDGLFRELFPDSIADNVAEDSLHAGDDEEDRQEKILLLEKSLFVVAEHEYFQFKRYESSSEHFERILSLNSGSELMIKSIYILEAAYGRLGQKEKQLEMQERLLNEFPFTDYAADLRSRLELELNIPSPGRLLVRAEEDWLRGNRDSAIQYYRDVIDLDPGSSAAQSSLMFLAHYYENIEQDLDSALHYYSQVDMMNFSEEYTSMARQSIHRIKTALGIPIDISGMDKEKQEQDREKLRNNDGKEVSKNDRGRESATSGKPGAPEGGSLNMQRESQEIPLFQPPVEDDDRQIEE